MPLFAFIMFMRRARQGGDSRAHPLPLIRCVLYPTMRMRACVRFAITMPSGLLHASALVERPRSNAHAYSTMPSTGRQQDY